MSDSADVDPCTCSLVRACLGTYPATALSNLKSCSCVVLHVNDTRIFPVLVHRSSTAEMEVQPKSNSIFGDFRFRQAGSVDVYVLQNPLQHDSLKRASPG
jgi:hypothetical protein